MDDSITAAGAAWDAVLSDSVQIKTVSCRKVIDTGLDGYVDLGAQAGAALKSLNDNFSIETYVYLPKDSNLMGPGHFIWTFASQDPTVSAPTAGSGRYMYLRASTQSFGIPHANGEIVVVVRVINLRRNRRDKNTQHNQCPAYHAGDFGMIYAVVGDNPALYPTTDVVDTFVYRALRQLNNLGMSTATGLFQSVVGFILVIVTNKITRLVEPDAALF